MKGRILVKFGYFLLIFVNVVPVAITKHGTQRSRNPHNHKHSHESDEPIGNEKASKNNRNHDNSAHKNSGHHNSPQLHYSPHQQNHQDSEKETYQNVNKLECKCDNILTCDCDSAVADPSAIGNFSCNCADKKNLYSEDNAIDCNCLKVHMNAKHLECQCIQNNGLAVNKTIDCPEATGYLIETDERLIDFSGINQTVHIFDKSKKDGQMRIHKHLVVNENFGITIPTVPKFPDDINPFSTTTSKKPSIVTTRSDMDIDFITTTPIPKVPDPPNDNEPLTTSTSITPPTKIPETTTAIPPPFEPSPELPRPFEPLTEEPQIPTEDISTEEIPTEVPEISAEEPIPPNEIPVSPTENPPLNPTTPTNPLTQPVEPPLEFPKPPGNDCPKLPEVNWGKVTNDYKFCTMIIEITWTEFKYIYETYFEYFENEQFDLCNGTYVNGHVMCNSNEITEQCTKANRCNCICIGQKVDNNMMENCFCNPHVLQPVVKYPPEVDLKECRCYNTDHKGNSLICDCSKVHSADKVQPLVLTDLHIIDISIIVRYLAQFNFEGDVNICGCVFYNGRSSCECKDNTEYYTVESTADCLCFYKFQHRNMIGHCYCADGIKDKKIDVQYNKDIFVVQMCTCHNPMNEGTSLKCSCEDYSISEHNVTYDTVQIDLSRLHQMSFNIILNYFLQIYEYRYEHFEVCACKISNGKACCSCFEPVRHCTKYTPCSCLSVYQYQQGNWIRMLFCNSQILESKYKFNEKTTELDDCSCHHTEAQKLICECGTIFSIDSAKQRIDFNKVSILDLTQSQAITRETLLSGFSEIREYHNETFKLCNCGYGSNDFMCLGLNFEICKPENPCKCLCIAYVENDRLGSKCICNPHVEEAKVDYNPAIFDLEIFTCVTPMSFFLSCNYKRKEAVNYKFTKKSIIETYLETHPGQNVIYNTTPINGAYQVHGRGEQTQGGYWQSEPGGSTTSEIRIMNYTVPGGGGGGFTTSEKKFTTTQGQGSTTSQVHTTNYSYSGGVGGGLTTTRQVVQSGPIQGSSMSWQSGPIPAGSTSWQSGPIPVGSTNGQSGSIQAGSTSWQSGPIPAGSTNGQSGSIQAGSTSWQSGPIQAGSTSWQSGPIEAGSKSWQSGPIPAGSTSWQSGPIPAGSKSWQSGPIPAGSTSWQSGPIPAGSTSWQSGPISAGSTSWQSGPIPAGSATSKQFKTMNVKGSGIDMQKFMKSDGADGTNKVRQYVQNTSAEEDSEPEEGSPLIQL